MLKTILGRLRVVAFLEGVSFLVLLGIAMPLKYFAANPEPVRIVGMAHGVLFIAYVFLLIQTKFAYNWTMTRSALAFVASLVPFGTFYADKKWFREK
jgi:integral membrane protein